MDILGILKLFLDLWKQREIIKIRVTNLNYKVIIAKQKLVVYFGLEYLRAGGKERRYIAKTILEPDKEKYSELQQYFKLPKEAKIEIDNRVELPRDKIVPSQKPEFANYPEFAAVSKIEENELESIQTIADKLSQKTLKVGLVWDDTGKITWKTVSKEDWGQWI